jgi:hypothetical protein
MMKTLAALTVGALTVGGTPVAQDAGAAAAVEAAAPEADCSWTRDAITLSTYSTRSCSNGATNKVSFDAEWKSLNNDALLFSYGYCSSSNCGGGGYRNSG